MLSLCIFFKNCSLYLDFGADPSSSVTAALLCRDSAAAAANDLLLFAVECRDEVDLKRQPSINIQMQTVIFKVIAVFESVSRVNFSPAVPLISCLIIILPPRKML